MFKVNFIGEFSVEELWRFLKVNPLKDRDAAKPPPPEPRCTLESCMREDRRIEWTVVISREVGLFQEEGFPKVCAMECDVAKLGPLAKYAFNKRHGVKKFSATKIYRPSKSAPSERCHASA